MRIQSSISAWGKFPIFSTLLVAACLMVLGICNSWAISEQADGRGPIDPAVAETAKKFLYGWADGDKQLLQGLMAKEPANFYGPCLFTKMPILKNARVMRGVGMVDFEGEPADPALPKQGAILMNFKNLGAGRKWYVRAIVWKGANALAAQNLAPSPTSLDRSREAAMKSAATQYLQAWLKHDWPAMGSLTFDWLGRRQRPMEKAVKIKTLKLQPAPRADGSARVNFTVTATPRAALGKFITRTADGILYAVKENGAWRIRGITASF
jgi:hypothetical protein